VVDVLEQKLPAGNWSAGGTHALGLAAIVELARSLDLLPKRLVVVGVEAGQFAHGAPLSEAVQAAVPTAAEVVLTVIEREQGGP
jgi:hydrogenase maturation protease